MKGFKTIAFNIMATIVLVAEQQGAGFGLSPELIGYITVVSNIILRFLTNTAVGKSK